MSKTPSKLDAQRAMAVRKAEEREQRLKSPAPLQSELPPETKTKLDKIINTAIAKATGDEPVPPEVEEIARRLIAENPPAQKSGARDNKKSLTVWLDPVLVKKLKAAAVDREKTIEEIVAKAIAIELSFGGGK